MKTRPDIGGSGGTATAMGGAGGSEGPPDLGPPAEVEPPVDMGSRSIANGQPCEGGGDCVSGFCAEGVCCNRACSETCVSCKVAGLAGTCVSVPAGEDPRMQCTVEPPSSCGRAGGCDGLGRCVYYPIGTECAPQRCSEAGDMEIGAGRCAARDDCRSTVMRACDPGVCMNGRCTVGCSAAAPCQAGLECMNSRCVPPGPVLHYRFDEANGTTVEDASGRGHNGVYTGNGNNTPQPSTMVPPTMFTNPRSRAFGNNGRPAVQLAAPSALLRPATDFTLSVWYRATSVEATGSDLINLGGDYFLRLRQGDIEFGKRVSTTAGMLFALLRATGNNHLDGKWHHVAAASSSTGMRLYLDGTLLGSNNRGEAVLYNDPRDALYLGRDGTGATGHDFTGNLDDARIYNRPLETPDIAALAAGN